MLNDGADADLANALKWHSDTQVRDDVRLAMGNNRESNFQDDSRESLYYESIFGLESPLGTSGQFYAVRQAARIYAVNVHRSYRLFGGVKSQN